MLKMKRWAANTYAFFLLNGPLILFGLFVCALLSGHAFADDTDYLAGVGAGVKKTFGENSNFEHMLYLGEGIFAAIGYIKTKNVMLLTGVAILMIFTKVFFTAWA